MKRILALAALGVAGGAYAQSQVLAPPFTYENTVTTTAVVSTNPSKGATSFTDEQARARMTRNGYTRIGALRRADDGVWHASARKAGKPVEVSLDYRGVTRAVPTAKPMTTNKEAPR